MIRAWLRRRLGIDALETTCVALREEVSALGSDLARRDLVLRAEFAKDTTALARDLVLVKATTTTFEQHAMLTTSDDCDPQMGPL